MDDSQPTPIPLFLLATIRRIAFYRGMKSQYWPFGLLASAFCVSGAAAQLPTLEQPWLGFFAVSDNKCHVFKVAAQGRITLTPKNDQGQLMDYPPLIVIACGVEETLPDGKTAFRYIRPETLSSSEKATDKLTKTVIRGKVGGDASFELNIEQKRGIISMGGRVTDPGGLTKNPVRFTIRAGFPDAYSETKKEDDKEVRAFEKKIKNDRIEIKWTDGKRLKPDISKVTDAASREINGPGISEVSIKLGGYKGRVFDFGATPCSSIHLSGDKQGPLYQGFSINWMPDAAKDKDGTARFLISVK